MPKFINDLEGRNQYLLIRPPLIAIYNTFPAYDMTLRELTMYNYNSPL